MLPRGARIERAFGKSVYAFVPLPPEKVANFLRLQAEDTEAVVGPAGTVFPKLRLRGSGTDHWLRVEISSAAQAEMSNVIVDRIDDKPPVVGKSNAELMKEVGLTPEGKPLDPTKVE